MPMPTPYLMTRDNPNASVRDNGMRGWFYPVRKGGLSSIKLVVLHTAETTPSPGSAWNVAKWQRDTAAVPSSYHKLVDSDNTVTALHDISVAFHVKGFNTSSLGISWATRAHLWGRYPVWDDEALRRGAKEVAEWCEKYAIPVRLLTREQASAGQRGIAFHSTLDPTRRSDPGSKFPTSTFLKYVTEYLWPQEDDKLTPEQERKLDNLIEDVEEIKRTLGAREGGVALDDLGRLRRDFRKVMREKLGYKETEV